MYRITISLLATMLLGLAQIQAQVNPLDVTIARDSLGVPHIFGKTDAATVYGLAWAHAEDNFQDIETLLLAGKGMLGRVIGRKGAEADYVVALLRCRDLARAQRHTLSPQFLQIAEAYVQGINDYAAAHPKELRYRKAFPATVEDYLTTVTLSLSMISGLEALLPRIFAGKIPSIPEVSANGSNAFAIHPSRTSTGESFLAINSHQPLEGPVAWYEAHLQSEEGLNIIGGLFPGGPCIFLGTNEYLGWAHTVNNMDKVDVYQLRMKDRKSLAYRFDGQWEKLEKRKIKLRVKGIPIAISKAAYWSKYGATIKSPSGTFSVRFTANQDLRGLEQWWRMNKARNFSEFYAALSMQGLPMFNVVYADRYDTIFYISGGKMPLRNPRYNWTGTVPGDTSATLWNSYHDIRDLPQYLNPRSGYLYNTNHSPFLASANADNLDPDKYDRTSGYETYHNNRSARFAELIDQYERLSYEDFKKIKYDGQYPAVFRFPVHLDSMLMLIPETYPDIAEEIRLMNRWDRNSDTTSEGAALFRLLYEYISTHRDDFPDDTLTTTGALAAYRFARQYRQQYFPGKSLTLGVLQVHSRGNRSMAAWGLPDVLTAMYSRKTPANQLRVVHGESYIQLVRFTRGQLPEVYSTNCYGASARPASSHYTDQMDMFIRKDTRRMYFDKASILREARLVYSPGQAE